MNSSSRKLILSGWFLIRNPRFSFSSLRLQKFLFFYEMMSKVEGEPFELDYLKAYPNGPVFSTVYGDFKYEGAIFQKRSMEAYSVGASEISMSRAQKAEFLVRILSEKELSDLTHGFDMWRIHETKIKAGFTRIPMMEADFTLHDKQYIENLLAMYPLDYINSVELFFHNNKCFVLPKGDMEKLTEQQEEVLYTLAYRDDLENPIFVEIDEDGAVLVLD